VAPACRGSQAAARLGARGRAAGQRPHRRSRVRAAGAAWRGSWEGGGGVGTPRVVADDGVAVADRAADGCGEDQEDARDDIDSTIVSTRRRGVNRPGGDVNPETPKRCSSATMTRRRGS
jgi:hypothetical protein